MDWKSKHKNPRKADHDGLVKYKYKDKKGKIKTLRGFQSKLAWQDLLIPSSAQSAAPSPPFKLTLNTMFTCVNAHFCTKCKES